MCSVVCERGVTANDSAADELAGRNNHAALSTIIATISATRTTTTAEATAIATFDGHRTA